VQPNHGQIDNMLTVSPHPTADEFRDVVGRFASGVTVITTQKQDAPLGATASAVSSLSLEPPMLLVCLNRDSLVGRSVSESGHFAVNVLGEDHGDLAVRFASPIADRFAGVRVRPGSDGLVLLADAIATMECRVVETVSGGTHYVFIGEVQHVSSSAGSPLAYFRGRFGRLELTEDVIAIKELRNRVLRRDLPVGEPIDLDALAAELSIPRGSVYHALSVLADDGYVDRDPNARFLIPRITLGELQASAHARIALFAGAAMQAAAVASPAQLEAVKVALANMRGAAGPPLTFDTWYQARRALIQTLVQLTNAPCLLDAFDRADVPAQIFGLWSAARGPQSTQLASVRRGYADIVDACRDGRLERLPAILRDLSHTYQDMYGSALAHADGI
jgi:flavin reductase (DIM6/NTAB) family NADH-FMN oxidoreductase RutF/DNA-binding GntR family transcriptional regulator